MTKQQRDRIIIQILISIVVIIWMLFSFCLVDLMEICYAFDDFRNNDYQGIIDSEKFWELFSHYCVVGGLIGFFGIYMRNMISNILGLLWVFSFLGIRLENFAQFQPYFFTTWEGGLFLVDIGARVMVLLITIVGIIVTCRGWYRWYKKRKNEQ